MSESPSTSPSEGVADAAEPEKRPGRARAWLIGIAAGFAAWVAAAFAVLAWQPGRFTQIALILAVAALALVLPGSALRRAFSALCAVALTVGMLYGPSLLFTADVEFTVRGTARGQNGLYLVHTDYGAKADDDPGETFRNQDAPLSWKVNSSDWQGVLETLTGRRVRARVIGVRVADESVYRNILSVEADGA